MKKDIKKLTEKERVRLLSKYFELQLTEAALEAYKSKDYLKSAMLYWSYIEEYFLPTIIKQIASAQNLQIDERLLSDTADKLLKYYLLISYDRDLYDKIQIGKKLRNEMSHRIFKSASLKAIEENTQKTAEYLQNLVLKDIYAREMGEIIPPSLTIAIEAKNSLRAEIREKIQARIKELEAQLTKNQSEKKPRE